MSRENRSRPATTPSGSEKVLADLQSSYASGVDKAICNARRDWWFDGALMACRQLALSNRGFDADSLLDLVGEPPAPEYVGALFAAAQRLHIIEAVGCRVGRDSRLLRVWWGVR